MKGEQFAETVARKAAPRRRRKRLDQRLMELSGTDWCGNDAPPLTNS